MAIQTSILRQFATRGDLAGPRTAAEARQRGARRAFLCHSHRDRELALGLVRLLASAGCVLYVDWNDPEMPDVPDRTTAIRIQQEILASDLLLFLATEHSMRSRWCPWEIGYADSGIGADRVVVVPTVDGMTTYGNEYLQLYRRVDRSAAGVLEVFAPGERAGVAVARGL